MLQRRQLKPAEPVIKVSLLDGKTDEELIHLRAEIDSRLHIDPKNLNMAEELGMQYKQGKILLSKLNDPSDQTPTNQKAQVFNSVQAMLAAIVKQTEIVYSSERLKRYEAALLRLLMDLPKDSKEKYFEMYGEFLAEVKDDNA